MNKKDEIINYMINKLSKSNFRNSFKLTEKEITYCKEKGMEEIKIHAIKFIEQRLSKSYIENDGKQTPIKGHPVFIAQHATATCCRGCLEKWHNIKKAKELTQNEKNYIVYLILKWLEKEIHSKK